MTGYRAWRDREKPAGQLRVLIDAWRDSELAADDSVILSYDVETWLNDRRLPRPDMVRWLALYGKARLLTQGWTSLPVDIAEIDREAWREDGFASTLDEHHEEHAEAIGGFLQVAGASTGIVVPVLKEQLQDELVHFSSAIGECLVATPTDWTNYDIDEYDEEGQFIEDRALDEPFILAEQLTYFAWALEKARILSLTTHMPSLGLPNRQLHDALSSVDDAAVWTCLREAEPQLRKAWRRLTRLGYIIRTEPSAPKQFWWRHTTKKMQADAQRSS